MPKILLSQTVIKNDLICPEPKRKIELCDLAVPGLYIECRSTCPGKGTFYLRFKNEEGKTCHQKLGCTEEITVGQARKLAKDHKAAIRMGANPREEAKRKKQVITLGEFAEEYLNHAKNKRSIRNDRSMLNLRIKPAFGDTPLNRITRKQIQQWHNSLLDQGIKPATANRSLALVKTMMRLAVSWEHIEKNVAEKIPLFYEAVDVERFMSEAEQARLVKVLNTHAQRVPCLLFLFLLSTGARLGETLKATFKNIDVDKRLWKIPSSDAKSRRVRSVPLNDSALDVLSKLPRLEKQEFVFVNRKTGTRYVNVNKTWHDVRERAGLPKLRIHDLRHQAASNMVSAGRTLYEVQQILGHSDPSVTQRYASLSTSALQDAANSASVSLGGCPPDGAER